MLEFWMRSDTITGCVDRYLEAIVLDSGPNEVVRTSLQYRYV